MPRIQVHFLPELVPADSLRGSCCVVIDVLRATTTIIEALANQATAVIPCLTIDDARQRRLEVGTLALLGGERGGKPIDGFDLGNSPAEYTPAQVGGRTVVLTTTNGTKALLHCRAAKEILVAGFVNLEAVRNRLRELPTGSDINILCAGTDGLVTREDVLVAGAVVTGLDTADEALSDQALLARDAWQSVAASATGSALAANLTRAMCASRGGRNLIEIRMAADIELAARIDLHAIVPRFDASRGEIRVGAEHA